LIPALGWRTTFQILSGVFLVMTMVGATLLKNPPAGYRRELDAEPVRMPHTPTLQRADAQHTNVYLLWIAFAFGTTAGQMTISQLVPFARAAGLGATVATYSLIVTSFGNAGGRILSGWMSDTIGRLRTLQMMVFLSAIAMPALFLLRTEVVPFFADLSRGATERSCRSLRRRRRISTAREIWG
jgi:OFA family oxalate/formate antiporter-like MFS transporter